ncbi:MAG: cobalamin-dependent protein [Oscillospiraceae bacterium]|nr:cobalamin-dependent protein [Oscillospiraceae bacterium]
MTAVEKGKIKEIEELVKKALAEGESPDGILSSMIETMGIVGDKFQRNEVFIPEMMVAAMAMKKGVAVLRPLLMSGSIGAKGKLIIGTVRGDHHDIGKNLVALMTESAGFEVIDLGVDVSPEQYVDSIRANPDCKLVGLSALLTTTMEAMEATVKAITEAGFRQQVKIMVGGAPITPEFAEKIGADAYAADAGSAARKASELVSAA